MDVAILIFDRQAIWYTNDRQKLIFDKCQYLVKNKLFITHMAKGYSGVYTSMHKYLFSMHSNKIIKSNIEIYISFIHILKYQYQNLKWQPCIIHIYLFIVQFLVFWYFYYTKVLYYA